MLLEGKKALVTGGSRSIGLAIAKHFLKKGANVVISGKKTKIDSSLPFDYHSVDFSDTQAVSNFAKEIEQMNIDILVNCAGINIIDQFCDIKKADFNQIQQINVTAPFELCQAVLPSMKSQSWGRIINISSIWGNISKAGRAAYSTSKFGIDGMTAALAAEFAQHGVLANCISPGFIETDLTRSTLGEQGMKEIAEAIPMKRLGQAEEIAALAAWLASTENSYISGQNIVIDGGFTRV